VYVQLVPPSVLKVMQLRELSNVKTLDEMMSMNGCGHLSNLTDRCMICLVHCCMIWTNLSTVNCTNDLKIHRYSLNLMKNVHRCSLIQMMSVHRCS
jgi:hypothetical protein